MVPAKRDAAWRAWRTTPSFTPLPQSLRPVRESDHVEVAIDGGAFEEAAAVSHDGDTEGCVVRLIFRHQLEEALFEPGGIRGKGNTRQLRIPLHPAKRRSNSKSTPRATRMVLKTPQPFRNPT